TSFSRDWSSDVCSSDLLPIEFDCTNLAMGDVIDVYPYAGKVCKAGTDEVITTFELKTDVLLDEVRAGGRIPLIVGRGLTEKAREIGRASCREGVWKQAE